MNTFRKKRQPFFSLLKRIFRSGYPRHAVIGAENVLKAPPAVFICNHAQSYAPIVLELYFPFAFRPWVIHDMLRRELCSGYLEEDFIRKELGLRRPLSKWAASVLALPCIWAVKAAGAIPVFKGTKRIKETFDLSMDALRRGENLVIFPERPDSKFSEYIDNFQPGFVHLARLWYNEKNEILYFYPVYVDKNRKTISIGKPAVFSPENDYQNERERILTYLRGTINELALMGAEEKPEL